MTSTSEIRTNIDETLAWLEESDKKRFRSARIAARVEGFRLKKKLQEEIKEGSPGYAAHQPLSVIASRGRTSVGRLKSGQTGIKGIGKPQNNAVPLRRLYIPVRYWDNTADNEVRVSVGFSGGTVAGLRGGAARNNQISKSWLRIARINQDGGTLPISPLGKTLLKSIGIALKEKGRFAEAKFYFWKKSRTSFTIPARPIIKPFREANEAETMRNIKANFEAKMRGERI